MPTNERDWFGVVAPTEGEETALKVAFDDANGQPVTGITHSDLTVVEVGKEGGDLAEFPNFGAANWRERGRGCYELVLSGDDPEEAALLDTNGDFIYYLQDSLGNSFRGLVRVLSGAAASQASIDEMKSTNGGTFDRDTDSLEAISNRSLGGGAGAYENTLVLSNGEGVVASGLSVYIVDAEGQRVAGPKVSNTNGAVVFYLDNGTYTLITPDTTAWIGSSTDFTVDGVGEHQMTIDEVSITSPPNGSYCVVYGFSEELDGTLQDGYAKVTRVYGPETRVSGGETVDVVYNKQDEYNMVDGKWEITILQGAEVDIKVVYGGGEQRTRRRLTVPELSQANWQTIEEG
jgi:hypothetical protein